ncbi:hypothetical protein JRQ81_005513 [Phrynocephalus forsythii]|uniref:Corticotropin-releasing factor domain-containing protein n=1 Tax=Phrynocephalus forsythii TaxID=171643 RepID=A0A9Q0Y2Z0_9SAUR|nr:hypothetical protein JRQ81_005513 [Phrynocephalus forsythii]
MRRRRLPALVASLLLLAQVALPGSPALALGGGGPRDGATFRLKLLLLGEDLALRPMRSSWRAEGAAPRTGSVPPGGPAWDLLRRLLAHHLGDRLKRHDPPLSIDLTFHLLRQMMEISRVQSQQLQAEKNRVLLDSVGK